MKFQINNKEVPNPKDAINQLNDFFNTVRVKENLHLNCIKDYNMRVDKWMGICKFLMDDEDTILNDYSRVDELRKAMNNGLKFYELSFYNTDNTLDSAELYIEFRKQLYSHTQVTYVFQYFKGEFLLDYGERELLTYSFL